MADEVTDPSREMASLIDFIRAFSPATPQEANPPLWKALASGLHLDAGSVEFVEILAVVRRRLAQLQFTVSTLGTSVENDVAQIIQAAINRFANAFNPSLMHQNWQEALNGWIKETDATYFRLFSPTLVQYFPLKRLSDTSREEVLLAIRTAIADIDQSCDIHSWERQALKNGYLKLELTLKYFEFFGHDSLRRELTLTTAATHAVAQNLKPTSSVLKSAWNALRLAAVIADIVAAPSVSYHALTDYAQLVMIGSPPAAEQLLLPSPAKDIETSNEGNG